MRKYRGTLVREINFKVEPRFNRRACSLLECINGVGILLEKKKNFFFKPNFLLISKIYISKNAQVNFYEGIPTLLTRKASSFRYFGARPACA